MKKVIGYVSTKDLGTLKEQDIKNLDVINIAFGLIECHRVVWDSCGNEEYLPKIREINPDIKIVLSVGGDVYFALQTDMKAASKYLDYVQLMTYDLQGGFQKVTGHHAALYHSEGNLLDVCVDKAVKAFHEAGVPMEKLILGVPFYSRQWNGVKGEGCRHGLGMEADSVGGYGGDYAELKADWIGKNGFVRYWDEVAKVPYLFDGKTFVSYEDEESLGGKIEYLKEMGMGGIMFWDYKCDPSGELLGYIREQL